MTETKALGVVLLDLPENEKKKLKAFIRCLLIGSDVTFEPREEDIDGNRQCVLKVVVSSDTTNQNITSKEVAP